MADEADMADAAITKRLEMAVEAARMRAAAIPEGVAGDCHGCGEYSVRLVNDNCARCRDKMVLD